MKHHLIYWFQHLVLRIISQLGRIDSAAPINKNLELEWNGWGCNTNQGYVYYMIKFEWITYFRFISKSDKTCKKKKDSFLLMRNKTMSFFLFFFLKISLLAESGIVKLSPDLIDTVSVNNLFWKLKRIKQNSIIYLKVQLKPDTSYRKLCNCSVYGWVQYFWVI